MDMVIVYKASCRGHPARDSRAGRPRHVARQSEVKETTGKLAGPFLFSVMVVVVLAVIFLFLGILLDAAALLFVIWLVIFALLAKVVK